MNCELLFALADKVTLTSAEKTELESILKTTNNGTFMVKPLNDAYSFSSKGNKYSIEFSKDGDHHSGHFVNY